MLTIIGNSLQAQPLCIWDYESGNLNGTSLAPGSAIPASNAFTGGAFNGGINPSPNGGDALTGSLFPLTAARGGYYQAQMLCPSGDCDLTGFSARVESSAGGPTSMQLEYSTEVGFGDPQSLGTFPVSIGSQTPINLPVFAIGKTRITIRIYPTNGTAALGAFYVDEFSINGSTSAPLPATLIDFSTARSNDHEVLVQWSTASEVNVKHFDIEVSGDGKTFESAVTVSTKGAENKIAHYQHSVLASADKAHYFRLVTRDLDNSESTSNIVFEDAVSAKTSAVKIVSNANGLLTVETVGNQALQLFSLSGQLILEHVLPEGIQTIDILTTQPAGAYVAAWNGGSIKLIKS